MRNYSLCEVMVGVVCDEPRQGRKLEQLWQALFRLTLREDAPAATPTVSFHFKLHRQKRPSLASEICYSRHLRVWKTPTGFYLECGDSELNLDLSRNQAVGMLNPTFWDYPLAEQREFFLLSFLMLFRKHGLYGLHANGVLKEETGLLIVGGSGCGKTTLTLSLIQAGWHYLADDALTLRHSPGGIEALPLRRGFSCTAQTTARFPKLHVAAVEAPLLADSKKLVTLEALYPERFTARCVPQVLLFPKIGGRQQSQLIRVNKTKAMMALIQQSPGIMIDQSEVVQQLALLKQLVEQANCYQLLLGRDVYEAPAAVSDLLEKVPGDY